MQIRQSDDELPQNLICHRRVGIQIEMRQSSCCFVARFFSPPCYPPTLQPCPHILCSLLHSLVLCFGCSHLLWAPSTLYFPFPKSLKICVLISSCLNHDSSPLKEPAQSIFFLLLLYSFFCIFFFLPKSWPSFYPLRTARDCLQGLYCSFFTEHLFLFTSQVHALHQTHTVVILGWVRLAY